VQYLKVFKYFVQYVAFEYCLNTAKSEVFHKVFKYSGQSILSQHYAAFAYIVSFVNGTGQTFSIGNVACGLHMILISWRL